jgi:hypothetical protein
MKSANQKRKILVISRNQELAELAGRSAGQMAELIVAMNATEGLGKIR